MLYDLTSLQREANTRFGFSARRTLAAAQRCYEEHKALTYPRTNSRYLTSDMVAEIKPTAELVGSAQEYRKAAEYVAGLDLLPLARVVDESKVSDHHAIIPTRSEHDLSKMNSDDRRVYDLVARRFLAAQTGAWTESNHCWDTRTHHARARPARSKIVRWCWNCGILPQSNSLWRRLQMERAAIDTRNLKRSEFRIPRRYSSLRLARVHPARSTRLPCTLNRGIARRCRLWSKRSRRLRG